MNTFDDMKKKAAYLVESAENKGYEFNRERQRALCS